MKFEINDFEGNIDMLLANLIVENAETFSDTVSNNITALNSIGGTPHVIGRAYGLRGDKDENISRL